MHEGIEGYSPAVPLSQRDLDVPTQLNPLPLPSSSAHAHLGVAVDKALEAHVRKGAQLLLHHLQVGERGGEG